MKQIRVPSPFDFDDLLQQQLQVIAENGNELYVLFTADTKIETGEPWCPDCTAGNAIIRDFVWQLPESTVLLECEVARSEYKDNPSYAYRAHSEVKLSAVPTLIRWKVDGPAERLVEEDCYDEAKVTSFFSITNKNFQPRPSEMGKVTLMQVTSPIHFTPTLNLALKRCSESTTDGVQPLLLLHFTATIKSETGRAWCDDCEAAEPVIGRALRAPTNGRPVVLLQCDVSREEYKNKPEYYYRTHRDVGLTSIPTLIRWDETGTRRRLGEQECSDPIAVSALLLAPPPTTGTPCTTAPERSAPSSASSTGPTAATTGSAAATTTSAAPSATTSTSTATGGGANKSPPKKVKSSKDSGGGWGMGMLLGAGAAAAVAVTAAVVMLRSSRRS